MIIKGKAVGNIGHWGDYLPAQGENEKAIEHEIPGTARNLKEALAEMRDLSLWTQSGGNFLYHASFNPKAEEKLTLEQWMKAIDLVEEKMGFKGHQRIIYEHVKEGRQHFHVLWNRVDPETFKIRDIKGDRYTLRRCANQLEKEFGLTPTKAVRSYDDPRPYQEWEKVRASRSRIDAEAMKAELTQIWHATDCGKALIAAIEEKGYAIAKGDRRDFVVLDPAGDAHSLAKRLEGVRVADVRARFADVDRESLPNVAEVRATQRNRFLDKDGVFDREAAERDWLARRETGASVEEAKNARQPQPNPQRYPIIDRDAYDRSWQGKVLDAAMAHAAKAYGAEKEAAAREPRSMVEKSIVKLLAIHNDPADFAKALASKQLMVARTTAEGIAQYQNEIHARNLAADRAWRHGSVQDESLPRPKPFKIPELKPDQIVIVNGWGGVHKLGEKRVDLKLLQKQVEAGLGAIPKLETARAEMKLYRDLRTQKRLGREEAYYDYRAEMRTMQHQRHLARIEERELNAPVQWSMEKKSRSGIRVMTGAAGLVLGLADFLTSFFDPAPGAPAHREEDARPQSSRDEAIARMSKSLERDEPVQAYDIRSLSHHDLLHLRQRGEPYLRDLVMEYERKSLKYLREDPGRDR